MEGLDLDLDNYSFDDLLRLFKLPRNFDTTQLKNAKKIVFAVHPDKSGLSKEYFVFFLNAYKMVVQIHAAGGGVKTDAFVLNDDAAKRKVAETFTKSADFKDKFNTLFQQVYIQSDDEGYGDWLKSNEDLDVSFDARKKDARGMVVRGSSGVPNASPSSLKSASLGQSDAYASLKNVYTTDTVLGVSEEDFVAESRNVQQLKIERSVPIDPLSEEEAKKMLKHEEDKERDMQSRRAYLLVRESLKKEKQVDQFWGHLLRLNG